MRPWPATGLLALVLAGCEAPRQVAPCVELVLRDERPPRAGESPPVGLGLVLPLVPYESWGQDVDLQRSLLPEVRQALRASGRFGAVLGPGDPGPARRAAPWSVEVTLLEARRGRVVTNYGLSLVGLALQALGAPREYVATTVRLLVACGPRDRPGRATEGVERELTLRWIYEDSLAGELQEALEDAVRLALREGLEAALSPGE